MKRSQGKAGARASDGGRSGFGAFGAFGSADAVSSLAYLAEPPSFSAVSDPYVVVSLKNILKKDSTTKTKALEELLAYVQAHPHEKDGGVEEAVLEVWVKLYPRTAIDNARRVRELSHNVQFELMKSTRKRIERHIPRVVGAWLAGLYDRDRVAAKAASDGLTSFLNSPAKVSAFWNKCQSQILDYATEAINEDPETLSDERTTTLEDSEAKWFRVVSASLSLALGLLQNLDDGAIDKCRPKYDKYFNNGRVWKGLKRKDATVRKTLCQLLCATIDRKLPYAESDKVRHYVVTGGLKADHAGSALEYVRALTKLTQVYPNVWPASSNSASDPKSDFSRLLVFISKGSQGSPAKFWEYLDQLLAVLPAEILTPDAASRLLTSLKSGITHREEPRTNTSLAWKCYVDTAKRLLKDLPEGTQLPFVEEHLFPLFEQFLFSVSEKPSAIPLGPNSLTVFVEAYIAIVQSTPQVVAASAENWDRLARVFCAKIAGSLPEVSREYQQSQEKIGEEGRRWFSLVGQIEAKILALDQQIPNQTVAPSKKIVSQSIALLTRRNLKTFGAARILEYALSTAPRLFVEETSKKLSDFLLHLAEEDATKAMESPSSRYLLSCVRLLTTVPGSKDASASVWNSWAKAALDLPPGSIRDSTLASLISGDTGSALARNNPTLQEAIISQALALSNGHGEDNSWDVLETAMTYQSLTDENSQKLVRQLVDTLGKDAQQDGYALRALEIAIKGKPELVSHDDTTHTALIAHLLSLSEIGNPDVSTKAVTIRSLLDTHAGGKLRIVGVIQNNLERAGPQSLDIETLVRQAQAAARADCPIEELFPSTNTWMKELHPFLEQPINPSLSITNNLGGAIALVKGDPRYINVRVPRDRKGRAIPARMALYTYQLSQALPFEQLPKEFQTELLYLQCLTVQLVSDQLTCLDDSRLWKSLGQAELVAQAEEFVSSMRGSLNVLVSNAGGWTIGSADDFSPVVRGLVDLLLEQAKELSPRGLYSARALGEIVQSLTEAQGMSTQLEASLIKPGILKATAATVLPASALIAGIGETLQPSKAVNTFCNRLVSDVAGASLQSEKTLMMLVLLSACAQVYEVGELPVANNRIVFAVRQIASWLEDPENLPAVLCAEICRCLNGLLPCMKDVYGSYWETTIEFCISLWNRAHDFPLEDALPFIHSSLRLAKTLEGLQDPNDDLLDAIKEFADDKPRALIELLRLPRETSSQPLDIVDAMLCREVEHIPVRFISDPADIFGLVASESREIQTAAFTLLHRVVPKKQEQSTVETVLDKTDARLPDELLSLLLDAPTLEKYSDEMLAEFPTSIRSYLLSWKLIFDAFTTASFKIRTDFTESLRTDNYAGPLLEFMFDVLGHSAAHPLNLDKVNITPENITNYDIKIADGELEEKNMQWLLVHLFYLTLKYIPTLFRQWYLDCRSKQTRVAVESWTAKFISPLIISDALDDVQTWADSQEAPAMDEQELTVRIARTAREVTAGYEVDEEQASIVIKIPESYPIEGVTVAGLHRVAVNERKWQSWIMTTQGVITFSNGNIIDGLQVFKRNIVGALKGQSECAICYSIISTDKRMPDKKCSTCKNMFHRVCLFKWFQTSNQNTCPLCRNPIDYREGTKRR